MIDHGNNEVAGPDVVAISIPMHGRDAAVVCFLQDGWISLNFPSQASVE